MTSDDALLLKPEEAAKRLQITRSHIMRLVDERKIGFVKVGRYVRFTDDHLKQYISEQSVAPGEWYVAG
jgi:excisionase family DNA binding protein